MNTNEINYHQLSTLTKNNHGIEKKTVNSGISYQTQLVFSPDCSGYTVSIWSWRWDGSFRQGWTHSTCITSAIKQPPCKPRQQQMQQDSNKNKNKNNNHNQHDRVIWRTIKKRTYTTATGFLVLVVIREHLYNKQFFLPPHQHHSAETPLQPLANASPGKSNGHEFAWGVSNGID